MTGLPHSRSWGSLFAPEPLGAKMDDSSPRSSQRSATPPTARSAGRSADGGCTARSGHNLADLARQINPVVRGWLHHYAAFYRSALYPLLSRNNSYLMRWIGKKYRRLRDHHEGRGLLTAPSPASIPGSSRTGHGRAAPGGQDDKSPVTGICRAPDYHTNHGALLGEIATSPIRSRFSPVTVASPSSRLYRPNPLRDRTIRESDQVSAGSTSIRWSFG